MRAPRRSTATGILAIAGLGGLVLGLYADALVGFEGGQLRVRRHWIGDDRGAILHNPWIFEPGGWRPLLLSDYWAGQGDDPNLYRPLTLLSLHANARLAHWQRDPVGFRAANVGLLFCVSALLFLWLRALGASAMASAVAGALVALHPSHSALVNQIVGRADLLAVAGILAFAAAQARALARGRWSLPGACGAALAAAVALGGKETGLLVVPVAMAQSWVAGARTARAHVGTAVLVGLPLLLYLAGRAIAVGWWPDYAGISENDLTGNPLRGIGFPERLPGALAIAALDLRQLVWPDLAWNLAPARVPRGLSADVLLGAATLGAGAVGLALSLWRRQRGATALAIAAGHYAMVGNLLFPSGVYAANRLVLPFAVAAAALVALGIDRARRAGRRAGLAAAAVAVALALTWIPATVRANREWRSMGDLVAAQLARHPDRAVSLLLRGAHVAETGGTYQAIPWLERAVAASPGSFEARRHLANAYVKAEYHEKAIEQYERMLEIRPDDVDSHLQLAAYAIQRGAFDDAERHLESVAEHGREHPMWLQNRAALALGRGDVRGAVSRFEALVARHPDYAPGREGLRIAREALARSERSVPSPARGAPVP